MLHVISAKLLLWATLSELRLSLKHVINGLPVTLGDLGDVGYGKVCYFLKSDDTASFLFAERLATIDVLAHRKLYANVSWPLRGHVVLSQN